MKETELLKKANKLILEYISIEYGTDEDKLDLDYELDKIGLAFTTITDEEHEIQVEADLINYCINKYINGKLFESKKYDNLNDLIENQLHYLNFDELISVDSDKLEDFIIKEEER